MKQLTMLDQKRLDQDQLARAGEVFADDSAERAQPYGPIGLVVSTIAILVAMIAITIVVAVAALAVGAAVLGTKEVLRLVTEHDASLDQPLALGGSIVVYAALTGAILAAARIRGGTQWRAMVGWRGWTPFRGSWFVWILYVAAVVYNIAASAAISTIHPAAKDWIVLPKGPALVAAFAVVAVVAAPIAEELLFRGWIYTSLRRFIGVPAGLVLSSALFALAHWESTHLYALVVFPLGLVLGYIRQRTGSILASMTFHALYNGFAVALLIAGF